MQGWASFSLQLLLKQVSFPSVHALPHVPQFELSVARVTQLPLQLLWSTAQQIPLVQLALAHCALTAHATPLPVGATQVALVPQTVPAAVQVPPGLPQQG